MKILRAYIDQEKPKECAECDFCFCAPMYDGEREFTYCYLLDEDLDENPYEHCPLIYAPSRSVMRRIDVQKPLEKE